MAMASQITNFTIVYRLFRRRWKKISKLRVTGLCEGNSAVTGEFPAQRASNAENVSVWWRHHVQFPQNCRMCPYCLTVAQKAELRRAFLEHQNRRQWRRVVPQAFTVVFILISYCTHSMNDTHIYKQISSCRYHTKHMYFPVHTTYYLISPPNLSPSHNPIPSRQIPSHSITPHHPLPSSWLNARLW